jgi:hypothetical protein
MTAPSPCARRRGTVVDDNVVVRMIGERDVGRVPAGGS